MLSCPCIILGHVNPSRYDMVERKIPKEKKRDASITETEVREGSEWGRHGLPADVGKRGWSLCTFTRERSQAASYAHGRWNRKKEGSVGEKGAESDGGAWGEIRNEREEKATHACSKGR